MKNWLVLAEHSLIETEATWLAGRILTLLKHYYVDFREPASLTRAIARDWIKALEWFCPRAIDHACLTWLGQSEKKPKISQIAALADAREVGVQSNMRRALLIISPPEPTGPAPESKEDKARRDACAKISEKYLCERAAREAETRASADEVEPPPRVPSPAARASLRKAQLENPLMFPPEKISMAHAAELRALVAWAKGEADIPKEFEAGE